MAALEARGIVKEFGRGAARTRVLRGVDWEVAAGELTFLVGESGSGKTTLLSILGGILTPDGGSVCAFGERLDGLTPAALARYRRDHVGFVFQQFNLLPTVTVAANVAVPLLARGVPYVDAMRRATAMLEPLGLGGASERRPGELSGGQQQRVAIARALVHEPSLLICDEPTASLDARNGRAVMELLRERAVDPERAVVVVTHDSRIFHYADRLCRIEDGRLTDDRQGPFPAMSSGH